MNGILLVDKPSGWTSFDVVNKIRRLIAAELGKKPRTVKVGHTGTLDPLATGLLVILVGDYCKRAGEFSKLDKTYEATMRLGQTSTTGDEEGDKMAVSDLQPQSAEIKHVLHTFTGQLMQTPPAYSAVKINGQRAYKLARAGKPVELEPRPITVYSIDLQQYSYPEVRFTARVSSGTYIRVLVEDIGKALTTGAYMSALQRTTVGGFELKDAIAIADLQDITEHIQSS